VFWQWLLRVWWLCNWVLVGEDGGEERRGGEGNSNCG